MNTRVIRPTLPYRVQAGYSSAGQRMGPPLHRSHGSLPISLSLAGEVAASAGAAISVAGVLHGHRRE